MRIIKEMGSFASYLTSVGFKPLERFPPIGTRRGKVQAMVFQPGSTYGDAIRIGEERIDDPTAIRTAYASYFFTTTVGGVGEADLSVSSAKTELACIYELYFLKSYRGEGLEEDNKTTMGKWVNALWEIRSRLGKQTTDRALFIGSMRSREIVKITDPDSYIRNVVCPGFISLANDRGTTSSMIEGILVAHGITQEK